MHLKRKLSLSNIADLIYLEYFENKGFNLFFNYAHLYDGVDGLTSVGLPIALYDLTRSKVINTKNPSPWNKKDFTWLENIY